MGDVALHQVLFVTRFNRRGVTLRVEGAGEVRERRGARTIVTHGARWRVRRPTCTLLVQLRLLLNVPPCQTRGWLKRHYYRTPMGHSIQSVYVSFTRGVQEQRQELIQNAEDKGGRQGSPTTSGCKLFRRKTPTPNIISISGGNKKRTEKIIVHAEELILHDGCTFTNNSDYKTAMNRDKAVLPLSVTAEPDLPFPLPTYETMVPRSDNAPKAQNGLHRGLGKQNTA